MSKRYTQCFRAFMILTIVIISLVRLRGAYAEDIGTIEQIYINMPDAIVYYDGADTTPHLEVTLDQTVLTVENYETLRETKEKNYYYVLLDISASIPAARFQDIKDSLVEFISSLRKRDRLVLLTFGESVTTLLNGREEKEAAAILVKAIENHDQKTVLFDAMETVYSMIGKAENKQHCHRSVLIISDGKDCADNVKSEEIEENKFKSLGIPVYTLAVENNQGDTAADIQNYRSKFSSLALHTGGIPWTIDQAASVGEGLKAITERVLSLSRISLKAPSNRVNNKMQELIVKTEDGRLSSREVLVSKAVEDKTPPAVKRIYLYDERSLQVTFSEAVDNAEKPENYYLQKNGTSVPILQVVNFDELDNTVLLILGEELHHGNYELQISHISDISNEKNELNRSQWSFHIDMEEETEEAHHQTEQLTEYHEFASAQSELTTELPETEGTSEISEAGSSESELLPIDQTEQEEHTEQIEQEEQAEQIDPAETETAMEQVEQTEQDEQTEQAEPTEQVSQTDQTELTAQLRQTEQETQTELEDKVEQSADDSDKKAFPIPLPAVLAIIIALVLLVIFIAIKAIGKGHKKGRGSVSANDTNATIALVDNDRTIFLDKSEYRKKRVKMRATGMDGLREDRDVTIIEQCVVGRTDCDVVFSDRTMSKNHFRLLVDMNGELTVEDMGSTNGTFVNGKKLIAEETIASGDRIKAGSTEIEIQW